MLYIVHHIFCLLDGMILCPQALINWLCKVSAHADVQKSLSTASVNSLVLLGRKKKSIVSEHVVDSSVAKIIQSKGSTVVEGVVTSPVLPQTVCIVKVCV